MVRFGGHTGVLNRRKFLELTALAGSAGPLTTDSPVNNDYESDFEIRPFSATAPDDVELKGHVYLPEHEEPPYGTVLYWSPYWNTAGATPSDDPPSEDGSNESVHAFGGLHRLIQEGFAVAAVNMRGSGISEGCFQWGSSVDFQDGYTVVEGLADEEWSNGKIGMYGLSYTAYSQTLAIAGGPPSLEAVVPVDSVIDLWKLLTRNGAAIHIGPATTAAWDGLVALGSVQHEPERVDCPRRLRDWTVNVDLATSGDKNEWFQERDYIEYLAESRVPMYVTNGLGPTGHILQIEGLYEARPPQTTRLLLGQWGHAFPDKEGFVDEVVQWFDHYLRDGPKRVQTGVVEYQDDTGSWYETDRWPPRADQTNLYLSDGALVTEQGDVESSTQAFQSEDTDPGVSPEHCGPRQAVYVSEPLEEAVRIAGNFTISATVTSSLSGGNFAAVLYHTPGDGTCPDPDATEFARCLASLRHWKTMGRAQRFPIGEPTEVSFTSQPFATEIPAGNRIVLAIGGGSADLLPNEQKPLLIVDTGEDLLGNVELPVVEGELT